MNKTKKILKGNIIIENVVNVWPHELSTAKALANAGFNVRFIPANKNSSSADAYIDGVIFEFKAPEGSSVKSIQRNIVKAIHRQSANIVIDSARIKKLKDENIEKYLYSRLIEKKGIKKIIFVRKDRKVVDINSLLK